jgi:hypothetical protein
MFRSLILSVALLVLALPRLATGGEAVALDAPQAAAIQSVIGAQLEAFQRDDGPEAFAYASPGIHEKFGSVANFMAMVRGGYPAVYRPREVAYLEARVKDGVTVQAVRLLGPDGAGMIALYFMEQQSDGSWRIDGVTLVESGEVGS